MHNECQGAGEINIEEDTCLEGLPYAAFLQVASKQLQLLHSELARFNLKFAALLQYFGEDEQVAEVFLSGINQFGVSFEKAVVEVAINMR